MEQEGGQLDSRLYRSIRVKNQPRTALLFVLTITNFKVEATTAQILCFITGRCTQCLHRIQTVEQTFVLNLRSHALFM